MANFLGLLEVLKLFIDGCGFVKLVGFSDWNTKTDERERYKESKKPFQKHWNENPIGYEDAQNWLTKGGWLGVVVPDGYIVVDVDSRTEGDLVKLLLDKHGLSYYGIVTPNGRQFIFRDTGAAATQIVKMVTLFGFVVDYRLARKGQFVLPLGDKTPGRVWDIDGQIDIDPMPEWFNPLKPLSKYGDEGRPFFFPIEDGSRDDTVFRFLSGMQALGRTNDEIRRTGQFISDHLCSPPFEEADEKINNVINRYSKGPNKQKEDSASPLNPVVLSSFSVAPSSGIVDGLDILLDEAAIFDGKLHEAAYHGLAGKVVRRIAKHSEASEAALLINFLTMIGNMMGTEPHFRAGGSVHRMRLYAVLVGRSFIGKKGSSVGDVRWLLELVGTIRIEEGISSGEGLIHAVRDKTIETRPIWEGKGKERRTTGEYEELVVDPGIEDKRLIIIESEFARVLSVMKREGNTVSPVIRNLWDGPGNVKTLTKNPVSATDTHVSILAHITPEELHARMSEIEVYNGLFNRFLWLFVEMSKELPDGGKFHEEDVSDLVDQLRRVLVFAHNELPINPNNRETLPMKRDEQADEYWNRIYSEMHRRYSGGTQEALMNRALPYIMRLSCIYALLDLSPIVRVEHLCAAVAIIAYCEKSVRFIFGQNETAHDPTGNKIIEALKARNGCLTATEINNDVFKRHVPSTEIKSTLEKLIRNGQIRMETLKGRGRPSQVFHLVDHLEQVIATRRSTGLPSTLPEHEDARILI